MYFLKYFQSKGLIVAVSLILGILVVLLDIVTDIVDPTASLSLFDLFIYLVILPLFLLFGMVIANTMEEHKKLNQVTQSISNVNQLIIREKNTEKLIQGVCDRLTQAQTFESVWIIVFDENSNVASSAESGIGNKFNDFLKKYENGDISQCIQKVFNKSDMVVIEDGETICLDCPLIGDESGNNALVSKLSHENKLYGLIAVSSTDDMISERGKQLFAEVVGDISYALHSIEAENKLEESEQKFRNYVDSSPVGIFVADKDGYFVDVNPSASYITGYSIDELLSMHILDLEPSDAHDQTYQAFDKLLKTNSISEELPFTTKSGNRRYWIIDAVKLSDNRYMGFTTDITKRKETEFNLEQALHQSKQRENEIAEFLNTTQNILEIDDFKGVARHIFDACSRVIGAKAGYVALLSDTGEENELLFLEDGGMSCSVDPNLPMPVRGLRAEAYHTGEVVYDNNFMNSEWVEYMPEGHMDLPNVLFSPLNIDGKTVGLLGFAHKDGDFTENDARLAKTFGEYAAIALKNSITFDLLEESEERYRSIFETAPNLITSVDENGIIINCNDQIKKYLGYEKDEIIGQSMTKIIHPDYVEKSFESLQEILQYGFSYNKEYKMVKKDGRLLDVLINSSGLNKTNEKYEKTICIITDITERKKIVDEIKKSEERFRTVIEQAADAIIAHDLDGNILYVNELACKELGYSKDELLSMNIFEIAPSIKEDNIKEKYWKKLSPNTSYNIEKTHKRKDGTTYPAEVKLTRIDLNDKPVILGFSRNITVRKQVEENLMNAKLEAEAASQAKSDLLANVSHELRTPLTSIIGFSDVMLKGRTGELNGNQENYLDRIHKSGKHLLDLITDILDLAKLESGKLEFHGEKILLPELINDLKIKIKPFASEKGLTLYTQIDSGITYIYADKIKLRQALYNLIYNAIKFTNEGSVTIEVRQSGDYYQFSVIDTGIGIPDDKQEEIFESFKQLDSGTNRKYSGTGLGLALVKKLVEIHGGQLWVVSEEGEGSKFAFTIPASLT